MTTSAEGPKRKKKRKEVMPFSKERNEEREKEGNKIEMWYLLLAMRTITYKLTHTIKHESICNATFTHNGCEWRWTSCVVAVIFISSSVWNTNIVISLLITLLVVRLTCYWEFIYFVGLLVFPLLEVWDRLNLFSVNDGFFLQ